MRGRALPDEEAGGREPGEGKGISGEVNPPLVVGVVGINREARVAALIDAVDAGGAGAEGADGLPRIDGDG
ncbi:MAG: hypothetical protein LC748_15710 [Thermomicrobia bacterium]|nr:hypothetical protein [Thermomicrobia bacterium]